MFISFFYLGDKACLRRLGLDENWSQTILLPGVVNRDFGWCLTVYYAENAGL